MYMRKEIYGITGDATIEGDIDFAIWHNGVNKGIWLSLTNTSGVGWARGLYSPGSFINSSVFARDGNNQGNDYYARAVIVNGIGF